MQVREALEMLQEEGSIIVAGKTFEVEAIDELQLETGEQMYWVRDEGDLWLSMDLGSDEAILFNDLEVEFDPNEDTIVYNGDDYEFSMEGSGTTYEDGEEIDEVTFRDFEGPNGRILRVSEYAVTGDLLSSLGRKVTEEELQPV